ncbi:hypothetical protein CcCBS67573_g01180 [Chytriomyces confervae]|uniref:Uncharacterized protein n=1 Tax=Chytriomyces confervae TaxID=246404 RepID=A0A507FMK8_9FUNG|nr:hypothetical protein CcCBS67573_g01180 [Chytriomyces confervae]
MSLYSVQQQYCLHFLHAHQENSRIVKKQMQTHQKQAQLGLLASQMMTHMTAKSVSLPIPRSTRSPPCSPPIAVGAAVLPSFNASSQAVNQAHSNQPSIFAQSASRHRDAKVVRYAPYTAANPASSSSVLRRAKPTNNSSAFVNTPPLSPLHQIDSKQSQQPPSPPQSIRTTSAESIQIQKIVMTALSTLRLPSHTIIMALFFVHKMLSAALPASHPNSSFFPSISHAAEPFTTTTFATSTTTATTTTTTTSTTAATDFAQCPVALFTAGLILADSMLCDAPVSITTWSWILSQSSPPFSAMAQKLLNYSSYARDLKRWALNLLNFDLNVSVELYADWVAHVKRFLNGQDALLKLHRQVKLLQQQQHDHHHHQHQQLLQHSLGHNLNLYSFY